MEVINHNAKRVDNNLLVVTHLTQLLYYITGFGGLIVPLILWLTQKDKVEGMDEHLVLPVTHTFMMRNNDVIDHAIHFLKTGQFIPD